jgi:hypothetical protein
MRGARSGREDHRGHAAGVQPPEHLESVDLGHLHVEEQHVRALAADRCDGIGAVAALGDNREIPLPGQQHAKRLPRQRLVVHDDRSPRISRTRMGHDGV